MTKITMPAIVFLALSGLMTGYLQSYGVFFQAALTSIVSSIIMIIGMLLIPKFGMNAAIIGFLMGSVAQVLFQRPFMKEYEYKFYVNFKDENLRKMLLLSIPVLISTAVGQVNVIVDSSFASSLPAGSISIIDYASKISTIINQVFIVSITTILYPMLTDKFSLENKKEFENLIIKSVNIVIIVTVPLLFGVIALSTPLIQLLLQHGKFKVEDTQITALCLKYLALGTLGYALMDILGKIFFSIKDTVTPMINGFITVGLNILFIVVLVPRLGISGLAIATTSSATIMAGLMFYELKKRLKNIAFKNFIIVAIKAIISGILMAILVSFTYKYMNLILYRNSVIYLTIKIGVATIIGIVSYLAMLKIFHVEELNSVLSLKKLK
jgi:putative peptidoglycan lipid II flippase